MERKYIFSKTETKLVFILYRHTYKLSWNKNRLDKFIRSKYDTGTSTVEINIILSLIHDLLVIISINILTILKYTLQNFNFFFCVLLEQTCTELLPKELNTATGILLSYYDSGVCSYVYHLFLLLLPERQPYFHKETSYFIKNKPVPLHLQQNL